MANAYDGRGYAWLSKHNYAAAITDFNEAIRFDPKCAETYDNRGIAHFNAGEPEAAVDDFTEAIRLGHIEWKSWASRGRALDKLRKYRGNQRLLSSDSARAARK
jgi:Flp pilus assembly protein TadD